MEKLLTLRDGSAVYRFHCDCLLPEHALDVTFERGCGGSSPGPGGERWWSITETQGMR